MKALNIIITIAITAVTYFVISYFFSEPDYVTSKRFEEAHNEVTRKIDSVKVVLDSAYFKINVLDTKVDRVQTDINHLVLKSDTLQAAVNMVYDEVKKPKSKSFSDKLFDYLTK